MLLFAIVVFGLVCAENDDFLPWANRNGKSYGDFEERARREKIYNNNLEVMKAINADPKQANVHPNKFSDMTLEEVIASHTGNNKVLETCDGQDSGCAKPLMQGDGHCTSDSDCMGYLVCGSQNCADFHSSNGWSSINPTGFDTNDNCCEVPTCIDNVGFKDKYKKDCSYWENQSCSNPGGYTPAEVAEIQSECCATCSGFQQSSVVLNGSLNWVEAGVVYSPENQGECGSCWAFTAKSTIESRCMIHHGETNETAVNCPRLSAQYFVDCVFEDGCTGGLHSFAFEQVVCNRGLSADSCYSYTGNDTDDCAQGSCSKYASIESYHEETGISSVELFTWVQSGPVAASISVSVTFQHYHSGVIMDQGNSHALSHAVVIVGYGNTDDGTFYWLVKNSWGTDWGQGGYAKICETCLAILTSVSVPYMGSCDDTCYEENFETSVYNRPDCEAMGPLTVQEIIILVVIGVAIILLLVLACWCYRKIKKKCCGKKSANAHVVNVGEQKQ